MNKIAKVIIMDTQDIIQYEISYAQLDGCGIVGMLLIRETGVYVLGWIHPRGVELLSPIGTPFVVPTNKAIVIDYGLPLLINPGDLRKLYQLQPDRIPQGMGPFTSVQIPSGLFHPQAGAVWALIGRMPKIMVRPAGRERSE